MVRKKQAVCASEMFFPDTGGTKHRGHSNRDDDTTHSNSTKTSANQEKNTLDVLAFPKKYSQVTFEITPNA